MSEEYPMSVGTLCGGDQHPSDYVQQSVQGVLLDLSDDADTSGETPGEPVERWPDQPLRQRLRRPLWIG